MGFERVGDILRDGDQKGYGVAAFNCFNFESIKYVIEAGKEEGMPVIIMLYPAMRNHIPMSTFALITKDLAAKAKIPVGLHLDHCDNYELLLEAMHVGFQSVIIDASKFDYQTNLRMTQEVVRAAHAVGCEVEAELGHVGSGNNADDFVDKSKYTDPDMAAEFVADTGVDSLAVAIGNGHGQYIVEPNIDMERVRELNERVNVPLVMHGGSGIPDTQLAECVRNGVIKHNFGTYLGRAYYEGAAAAVNTPDTRRNGLWLEGALAPAVKEFARGRIRTLNPDNIKL